MVRIDKVYLKNDGSAEAEISWRLENPAIIKDFSSEYGCACMQPDAHSHAVKVELSYKGKYYAAAPDTDYRLNGITAMTMPINVVQYRRSKAHAAAKAAAVLATPFTAAADVITLPIQIPVFIHGLSSIRY